jgi:arsenate reductase (thioredoxin)
MPRFVRFDDRCRARHGAMPVKRNPRLLFVCVENACRSQMAASFARMHGRGRVDAISAGSRPAAAVNPRAIAFMAERGCDISACVPGSIDDFRGQAVDVLVTMGCGDACPWLPAQRREDWALPDPRHLPDNAFRAIRDDIERRVLKLLEALGAGAQA